jgi:hypothetical protein
MTEKHNAIAEMRLLFQDKALNGMGKWKEPTFVAPFMNLKCKDEQLCASDLCFL